MTARPCIDLNADVGEGFDDASLMPWITSANIACGAHAGDADTMRAALALARRHGVAAGAHPGYADRAGFGRRATATHPEEVFALVAEQLRVFAQAAKDQAITPTHVKPHGALYHAAGLTPAVAQAFVAALCDVLPGVVLFGPPDSQLNEAAREAGVPFVAEGFIDRHYQADGQLVPRAHPQALVNEPPVVLGQRALDLVRRGGIDALAGGFVPVPAQTLCLHGDRPDAAAVARAVRTTLEAAGVSVTAPRAQRPDT